MNLEDKFIIKENSENKTFYKLMQFDSTLTKKSYLLYTDNKKENNHLNIYASIIEKENDKIKFIEIIDDIDKKEVQKAIEKYKKTDK